MLNIENKMSELPEGAAVVPRNGKFDAEVVIEGKVVWRQRGFSSLEQAKSEADLQLINFKQWL